MSLPEIHDLRYEDHKDSLRGIINESYPVISTAGLAKFRSGEIKLAAFNIRDSELPKFLYILLERAKNPDDEVVSKHGLQHFTYLEAIHLLQSALKSGRANLEQITVIPRDRTQGQYFRYRLETQLEKERQVNRSQAFLEMLNLRKKIESISFPYREKNLSNSVRKIALERNIPFALLVCAYLNLQTSFTFNAFLTENFKQQYDGKWKTDSFIPKYKRPGDAKIFEDVKEMLLVPASQEGLIPSFSFKDYENAVNILDKAGWIELGMELPSEKVKESATALTIISSPTERAQELADPYFRDPAKTVFIHEEWGNLISSEIITGYVASLPEDYVRLSSR